MDLLWKINPHSIIIPAAGFVSNFVEISNGKWNLVLWTHVKVRSLQTRWP